ncbi:MAG: SAM-dependent chlorinase/fluorinase [Bacteroidales bacterium]|nr:SAM-dependent chlorinase/fluorinase [Bacteroidales bacterium]
MRIITLTTEWQSDDIYQGIIKGKLCSLCPGIIIVDNAHGIQAFDILHASFVVRNTFENYPKGSIHIICIHSEAMKGQNHLVVSSKGHFFIGTDNGMFNLILNTEFDEAVSLKREPGLDELEVFARAAADIVGGKKLSEIGKAVSSINERMPLRATLEKDVITGSIIFIDSYGNAISNVTKDVFRRVFEEKEYRIFVQSNKYYTDRIVEKYSDVPVGDMLARFNSLDLLEISINGANVSELLSLSVGSVLRIDSVNRTVMPNRLF